MNIKATRKYVSEVRETKASGTRQRILEATASLLRKDSFGDFTFDDIAKESGIERRTIFRHFSSKDILLESLWTWINEQLELNTLPRSFKDLVEGPKVAFKKFDDDEGVIRGSLHTRSGHSMRNAGVPARREAFHQALNDITDGMSAEDQKRIEAVAHVLYSAAAWETMRDYADLSGAEAGEAASWALQALANSLKPPTSPA